MREAKVKKLQARSFRERWPTEAVYDSFDVDSYLFGTDKSPGSRAAQAFLRQPPPKEDAEERSTGPLEPAMEFKFLQLTRQYLLRQNADEAIIQHIAPFLVPCLAAVLYRHLRGRREIYDDSVLEEPEAIVYGRIRLPLCKAVFPVLSKIGKLENEVRLLQLGLQDATEQGRERGVQLLDAVQHSETLQAEATRREEDLKRFQGTVVELQSTLDGVQRQLPDSQVRLENSEQRAADVLHQARAEAAQERLESDIVEVQAARSKDLAEREGSLVAALNKNAALEGNLREQQQEISQLRSSSAQLNHAARISDAVDIDTETKQARPPTGPQVSKSDSDRIQELERLLEEAKAENECLEEELDAAVDESDNHEFLLEQTKLRLESYATKNSELEASLKAAKDEVDRQRKLVNGMEEELQKLRSHSHQSFSGYHELDRLRGELHAVGVDKKQLERQVDNLRGILERTERELQTLRSKRGPLDGPWMDALWRKGNSRYTLSGTDLGRGVHGVVVHGIDTLNRRDVAIKITTCQPSGKPYNSAAREVNIMKKQRSVNVMSLLDVVYKESSGQHHAELWLVMDYMPTNLRALIYDHNRRPTIPAIKYYVQDLLPDSRTYIGRESTTATSSRIMLL